MGKIGRIACIFTPWALTLASFVCLILIELAGSQPGSSELSSLYFMRANFTNFVANTTTESSTLGAALSAAKSMDLIAEEYNIYLWNYCQANKTNGVFDTCSARKFEFVFDPIQDWGLNKTAQTALSASQTTSANSALASLVANTEALEKTILGDAGAKAMDTYRTAAKWMFIAYTVSFWTTLATLVVSILAVCSRFGSFLTWILSFFSTLFTFGAVITSTILFATLTTALNKILNPYAITLTHNTHLLAVAWLAVALSLGGTLFWLFSVCCCSGKSNPHHRSNKGGLWAAQPKGQGYRDHQRGGRGIFGGEKHYEPLGSPSDRGSRVPLQQFGSAPLGQVAPTAYEPYRHQQA